MFARLLAWLDRSPRAAVLLCGCLGTLLPAAFGLIDGIRIGRIGDEQSYLMAADTFARGRLTNPSPHHPEFFEVEHVLVVPTYMSKYPPGQGLALAAGQVLFGHPIAGVWLSCGCMAASLCWMLQAWTTRRWAWLTTLAFVISGTSSYWAQRYFGGAVPTCGAALLFGALRRHLPKPRIATSLLMGLGVIVLAMSRPYEGLLACVPVGFVLVGWLLKDRRWTSSETFVRFVLPFGAVLLTGGAALAEYNRTVTGSWYTLPYPLNHRQYYHSGPFIFSARQVPERQPHERLDRYYRRLNETPEEGVQLLATIAWNTGNRIARTFGGSLLDRWAGEGRWRIGLVVLACTLILSPKDRWFWFCVAAIVWEGLGASIVKWWLMHYSSPVIPLVLSLFANACRRTSLRLGRNFAFLVPLALLALSAYGFALSLRWEPGGQVNPRKGYPPGIEDSTRQPPLMGARFEMVRQMRSRPGRHLVFVRCADDYVLGDESVYNRGDLVGSPLVFAHCFGLPKDRELADDLPDRTCWLADVSDGIVDITPYDVR